MKKEYLKPEIETVEFCVEDVITDIIDGDMDTSGGYDVED